ncbi:coiled-coil domain-containing protein 97 isoform X2 [Esox lucius]|uniref:coiled-coil domain-containing protein 97 isoform X2 n=1 Tax=Esox lucius TaxID=8010 RepID=UPI001476B5F6|nr:coiled-coil domain-containing protein 97 isoform X2 [Esox lucius]
MWGEIDHLCDTNPPVSVESEACRQPKPRGPGTASRCNEPANTAEEPWDDQGDATPVSAMIEALARSGIQVKSQQVGDAELNLAQRREELLGQYQTKPLVFLERYQASLSPEHLGAFSHLTSDPRAQHYCQEVMRRAEGQTNRTRVRNQRYAALRELQKGGQYFSEEQMRGREPLLYEQYIGQYLTEEEVLQRSLDAMQADTGEGALGGAGGGGTQGGLAHLLLSSYQERVIQSRLQEEQDMEESAREEEDDGEEGDVGLGAEGWELTPQEKALLRDEFISQMHQRFLDGHDKDFNYSEVDGNPDYDNLDIVNRDAEEKYFDEEEEEEDESEEKEMSQ